MKKFMDYFYYRATKFYEDMEDPFIGEIFGPDYEYCGTIASYGTLCWQILIILLILVSLSKSNLLMNLSFIIAPVLTIILILKFTGKDKYIILKKKYKNKKNVLFKDWILIADWALTRFILVVMAIVIMSIRDQLL